MPLEKQSAVSAGKASNTPAACAIRHIGRWAGCSSNVIEAKFVPTGTDESIGQSPSRCRLSRSSTQTTAWRLESPSRWQTERHRLAQSARQRAVRSVENRNTTLPDARSTATKRADTSRRRKRTCRLLRRRQWVRPYRNKRTLSQPSERAAHYAALCLAPNLRLAPFCPGFLWGGGS